MTSPSSYFSGSSVTTTIFLAPSASSSRRHLGHLQGAVDRLAAGHRDRVVEEDLVGDVDARRDALAHREQPRVVVGAVAEVREDVVVGRERRLTDPRHAFAAHLAEGHGASGPSRPPCSGSRCRPPRASLRARACWCCAGSRCRTTACVRRWRCSRPAPAGCVSFASISAMRASMRAVVSRSMPDRRRASSGAWRSPCAMIAGVRSACARSSQFWLGFGRDHSPPLSSPSASSNLPSTFGRTSARQL